LPLPGQDQLGRRLAIVLVDRHLDLASPLLHPEQPADAMLAALPRQQAGAGAAGFRPLDVRVDAPACYPTSGPVVPGGCRRPLRTRPGALGAPLARPAARPGKAASRPHTRVRSAPRPS
jgi:hypothetical protein